MFARMAEKTRNNLTLPGYHNALIKMQLAQFMEQNILEFV